MARIDFFFDFISPYAYLAFRELVPRARERGDDLVLRPTLFAGLLGHTKMLGPAEVPSKRIWLVRDTLRRAARLDLPMTFPAHHPFRPLTALRTSLPEVAGDAQEAIVDVLFTHGWEGGGDLGDDDAIVAALSDAGHDGRALVERSRRPEVKASLKANTAMAIEKGVFGVPTMLAHGELFWGSDRTDDLFAVLDGELALDADVVAEILGREASAQRPR